MNKDFSRSQLTSTAIIAFLLIGVVLFAVKFPPHSIDSELFGALIGVMGAILIAVYQPVLSAYHTRKSLSSQLEFSPDIKVGVGVAVRIENRSKFMMEGAVAYIVINFQKGDIKKVLSKLHFIESTHSTPLVNDRLCWSLQIEGKNPYLIDIYPGEYQSLSVMQVVTDKVLEIDHENSKISRYVDEMILLVASEEGFDSFEQIGLSNQLRQTTHARVALTNKEYHFALKIVSKNTDPLYGKFKYIPENISKPIIFEKIISVDEYDDFIKEVHLKWNDNS